MPRNRWMAALIAAALALTGRAAKAAITVTSLSESGATFNYDVNFAAASLLEAGDGFVIADFGPVSGMPTFITLDGNPPSGFASAFTFSQLDGADAGSLGLNGETATSSMSETYNNGLTAGEDGYITTTIDDSDTALDAVFVYNGPTLNFLSPGMIDGVDLKLTLVSSASSTAEPGGTTLGVDHSGVAGNDLAFGESTVLVPTGVGGGVPEPGSMALAVAGASVLLARRRRLTR